VVFLLFCGCALRARHGLSVWAAPDRIGNTALLRMQCRPAKTAFALGRTIKNECVIFFCKRTMKAKDAPKVLALIIDCIYIVTP
jgi:bisphosphoglycerate-dependent phosphoglycerate mutase